MLKADALRILVTGRKVAKAAGVKPPTVTKWGPIIPAKRGRCASISRTLACRFAPRTTRCQSGRNEPPAQRQRRRVLPGSPSSRRPAGLSRPGTIYGQAAPERTYPRERRQWATNRPTDGRQRVAPCIDHAGKYRVLAVEWCPPHANAAHGTRSPEGAIPSLSTYQRSEVPAGPPPCAASGRLFFEVSG